MLPNWLSSKPTPLSVLQPRHHPICCSSNHQHRNLLNPGEATQFPGLQLPPTTTFPYLSFSSFLFWLKIDCINDKLPQEREGPANNNASLIAASEQIETVKISIQSDEDFVTSVAAEKRWIPLWLGPKTFLRTCCESRLKCKKNVLNTFCRGRIQTFAKETSSLWSKNSFFWKVCKLNFLLSRDGTSRQVSFHSSV